MRKKGYKSKYNLVISIIILILIIFIGYYENKYGTDVDGNQNVQVSESIQKSFNLDDIPEFDGKTPYEIINNNEPNFPEEDFNSNSFEKYSELDSLGRCGVAYANVCKEIMPPERR